MTTPLLGFQPIIKNKSQNGYDVLYIYQIQEPADVAIQMLWMGSFEASF